MNILESPQKKISPKGAKNIAKNNLRVFFATLGLCSGHALRALLISFFGFGLPRWI